MQAKNATTTSFRVGGLGLMCNEAVNIGTASAVYIWTI